MHCLIMTTSINFEACQKSPCEINNLITESRVDRY
jgi:hypothetical protein